MVGRIGRRRSHRRAAGYVRGQSPPDGSVASAIARDEPSDQRRGALAPLGPDDRSGGPPPRDRGGPARQRAPAGCTGAVGIRPRNAAVHAHEGVDRLVVFAVADRARGGEEPCDKDGRERVAVPRQELVGPDRPGRVASAAKEAPSPRDDDRRARGDHRTPSLTVSDDVARARNAGDRATTPTGRRSYGVDVREMKLRGWSTRGDVDRFHAPKAKPPARGGNAATNEVPPRFPSRGSGSRVDYTATRTCGTAVNVSAPRRACVRNDHVT